MKQQKCDTITSVSNGETRAVLLKCDTVIVRYLYFRNGHYDISYKYLNKTTFLTEYFDKKGNLQYKDTFDSNGNDLYRVNFYKGTPDTIW